MFHLLWTFKLHMGSISNNNFNTQWYIILHSIYFLLGKFHHISTLKLSWINLWLVQQKLYKELKHVVIPADHIAICNSVVEAQAFCAPAQVLTWVVGNREWTQGQCIELITEERKVLPIGDHSLGHKWPAHILFTPEAWREKQNEVSSIFHFIIDRVTFCIPSFSPPTS